MDGFVPILPPENQGSVAPPVDNSFQKGLRQGTTSLVGQGHALLGRAAETVGLNDVAADQYAKSTAAQQLAATQAPEITNFDQVHGLSDFGSYAAGIAGQSIPSLAPVVAGGLLAKTPVGKIVAGSLATAPLTIGGQIQEQQADPVQAAAPLADRNLVAGGVGAAQAVGMNVLPGLAEAKLTGALASTGTKQSLKALIAKNVAGGVAINSGVGAGSTLADQAGASYLNPNRDTSGDAAAVKESAIQQGLLSLPFGALGAAGEALHAKALPSLKAAVPDAITDPVSAVKGLFKSKADPDSDAASRVAQGLPLVDDAAYANADPVTAAKMEAAGQQTALEKTMAWGKAILDDNLTPDVKAKVQSALDTAGDAASQAYIAGLKVAKDASAAIQKNASDLLDAVNGRASKDAADRTQGSGAKDMGQAVPADAPLALRSEGDDGPRLAVANALVDAGADPQVAAANAGSVRGIIDQAQTTGRISDVIAARLHGALGDDAVNLLIAAHDKVAGGDEARTENFYKAIADLNDSQKIEGSLRDQVAAARAKDAAPATRAQLDQAVAHIRRHVDGQDYANLGPAEAKVKQARVEAALEEHFPGKSKQLLEAFAKDAKGREKTDAVEPPSRETATHKADTAEATNADLDRAKTEAEGTTDLTHGDNFEDTLEKPTYYGGGRDAKNPTYIDSGEILQAVGGKGKPGGQATRLVDRAKAENPDRSIHHVSAIDHAREQGLPTHDAAGKVLPHLEGKGLIEARGHAIDGRLTRAELDDVKLESKNFAQSNARVEHKSGSIDATKLTALMLSKMDKNTGESNLQRKARAFFDGIGAATDALGHKIDLPDDNLQIHRDGTTLGDIKKVKFSSADPLLERRAALRDLSEDKVHAGIETLETQKAEFPRLQEELEQRVAARIEALKAERKKFDKKDVAKIWKEEGSDALRDRIQLTDDLIKASEDELERRATAPGEMEYSPRATGRDAEIHEAAKTTSSKELVNNTGMDGSKNFVSTAGKDSPRVQAQVVQGRIDALKQAKTKTVRDTGAKLEALRDAAKTDLDRQQLARFAKDKDSVRVTQAINKAFKEKGLALPEKPAPVRPLDAPARFDEQIIKGNPDDLKRIVDNVKASTDIKALQAGLDALPGHKNSAEVHEAINARISELIEKDQTNAYELQLEHDPVEAAISPPDKTAAFDAYVKGEKYNTIADRATMERFLARAKERYDELRAQLKGDDDVPNFKEAQDTFRKLDELVGPDSDRESFFEGTMKDATKVNPAQVGSAAGRKIAEDYITKVLGSTVKTAWENLLHAGEFRPGKNGAKDIIALSAHLLNPLSTAYHESLHAFMQHLRSSDQHGANNVLFQAADTHVVRAQLEKHFANNPEALAQIRSSSEERAAYMYQLHQEGLLTIGDKTKNVFTRIRDFINSVLGTWTNDKRAEHILDYFSSGEYAKETDPNAVAKVLAEGTNPAIEKFKSFVAPFKELGDAISKAGDARLRDTGNPAFIKIADLVLKQGHDVGVGRAGDNGFLPASREARSQVLNKLSDTLKGTSDAHLAQALEQLQSGKKATALEARIAAAQVRKMLDGMHEYLKAKDVDVGDQGAGKDYFPRVWDVDYLTSHQDDFRTMMAKYGQNNAAIEATLQKLIRGGGAENAIETKTPGFASGKERKLDFIKPEDFAPFGEKDLWRTLDNYVTQATRRGEWAERFGDDSGKLNALLAEAKEKHGATREQIAVAEKYIKGINGTLGDNINPKLRRAMGNMMVYQNIRLLPLAVFSSVIDPLGVVVRGGTVGDAFKLAKRGFAEIPRNFQKAENRKVDEGYKLAQDLGTIDNAMLLHTLGSSYSQGMVGNVGRKINDTFFRYNLMEQFNTSMRVGATEAAVKFIGKHADGTFSNHSERWMAELGYKPGEVKLDSTGRPLIRFDDFKAAGMSDADATAAANKMAGAVNHWVDGAILRPNAAHKPIWANDPHFALMAHLKQFVYSFQHTIIDRVVNEAKEGNYKPGAALASYVPIMIAADMAKGLIQGGGQEPSWKEAWGPGDYVWSGVQRAGLLGSGQFLSDAITHKGGVLTLLGPTIEQFSNATQVVGGQQQFAPFFNKALPANALYEGFLGSKDVSDPTFSD